MRFTLPACLVLLLGVACARPPHASLDPAKTLKQIQAPQAAIPSGDLAQVLTALAWKDHPELAQAKAELEAAKAGVRTAKAIPNPTFGFGATKAEGVPQPWTLTYGLTFPIELGGKRKARVRQAQLGVEAAELAVADAAWRLRSNLRAALVDWQAARAVSQAADEEAQLRADLQAVQERRFQLGQIGAPERAAATLEAQRAAAARLAAATDLQRAEAVLALAAGVQGPPLRARLAAEPAPDLSSATPAPPQDTEALIHRLDVRRVLVSWDQNEASLDAALAGRFPNLSIGPGYSLDQGVQKWSLGLSVDLPLFDRKQGPIAEALARRGVIEAQLRQTESRALSDASLASARLSAAESRLQAQDEALAQQRARLAAAQRAFDLGGADRADLLAAKLESLQARSLATEAWAEAQRARLAWENAFQKPLDSHEQPYRLDGAQP
ncbi:MAG: TolC family protein [Acidobacteria bacterium]|nr:TolC family protein [Acidobacteriota bacterium]